MKKILGTCRLFNKPLLKTVLQDYSSSEVIYDTAEYYQNDHYIKLYGGLRYHVNYKLWILNGIQDSITERMKKVERFLGINGINKTIQFMIHTPTPHLRSDLTTLKMDMLKHDFRRDLNVSNFYEQDLETYRDVFKVYPKVNQIEINVNALNLPKTKAVLKFMEKHDIELQCYGLIRRGQYLRADWKESFKKLGQFSPEWWKLELAFQAALVYLKHEYPKLRVTPIISPNRGRPCLDWYEQMLNNLPAWSDDLKKFVENQRAFKDSPDYSLVGLGNDYSKGKKGHVYMAGPLFDRGQIRNRKEDECFLNRFTSLTKYNPINLNTEIWEKENIISCMTFYNKDIEEIDKADIMFADLDAMDPGTITEIGIFVEKIRSGVRPNGRLIVMASNWEYWVRPEFGEANPTLGINDFLEGAIRDVGFFIKDLDMLQNYIEDYLFDIELDNEGKEV